MHEDVKLIKPREFDKRFDEHLSTGITHPEAWELTEKNFQAVFGQKKYSSAESYRIARRKRIETNKQKK